MDSLLKERLESWYKQVEKIAKIEKKYLLLEGSEKALAGKLFLQSDGKSIAERDARAMSSQDWINFKKGLAEAKSEYNNEKRILELKIKAYEAEYITLKLNSEAIRKN